LQSNGNLEKLINRVSDTLFYLIDRWQDEKKYEDIKDYKAALQKKLKGGEKVLVFPKAFNRITLQIPGFPYNPIILITQNSIGWTSK
jgi:hypothetical protein